MLVSLHLMPQRSHRLYQTCQNWSQEGHSYHFLTFCCRHGCSLCSMSEIFTILQNQKAMKHSIEEVKSLHLSRNTFNSGFHLSVLEDSSQSSPRTLKLSVMLFKACALTDHLVRHNIRIPGESLAISSFRHLNVASRHRFLHYLSNFVSRVKCISH